MLNRTPPRSDVEVVDVLLDALFAMATIGPRRRRRPPRPVVSVVDSPWLTAAAAAVAVQVVGVVAASVVMGRFAFALLEDELLFILGVLLAPIALGGLFVALTCVAWLAMVIVKLVRCDWSARVDLAVAGVLGLLVVAWFGWALSSPLALAAAVPSAVCLVVAVQRDVWRPLVPSHP